jgi:hypothetical protein
MKLFGLEFPERKRPVCETCAEPMVLTARMPDPKNPGHELQVLECYACRRELVVSAAINSHVESPADH